ncbi:MAG: AraC family transcriptional regulator, partial [Verrucomicrobia bacterium]
MVSNDVAHAEQGAWKGLAPGWRQLYGDFGRLGLSIEWHDFRTQRALDWGRSFHPHSVEFCLNLDGRGAVRAQGRRSDYLPGNSGYYAVADEPLSASRQAHDHHQFVTLEFSRNHLQKQFVQNEADLEPE